MFENIISYVNQYKNVDFETMNFNEVDALVLSQFVYLKLDDLVPHYDEKEKKAPLKLCHMAEIMDEDKVFLDKRYEKDNRALFEGMLGGTRFGGMRMHYYSNIISIVAETQFSALTVFLEKGPTVIVFRGTDETLVGWKEDFNMFLSEPVMGQELSALYLKQVGAVVEGNFLIVGHSKGGNLAVYSTMNVGEELQSRIEKVYSFDSPGFRPEILASVDFNKIKDKIKKYLPHSCMVGMILQSQEPYRVVECTGVGFLQHNPYNWHIKNGHFEEREDVAKGSKVFNETINQWLLSLSEEELHAVVEIWYEIAKAAHVKDLLEVAAAPAKTIYNLWGAVRNLDEEKRKMARELMASLLLLGRENSRNAKRAEKVSD